MKFLVNKALLTTAAVVVLSLSCNHHALACDTRGDPEDDPARALTMAERMSLERDRGFVAQVDNYLATPPYTTGSCTQKIWLGSRC